MLDEKIELEEYTCPIKEKMPQRLTYLNTTTGLSGVPRALKVIARHALYDLGMNPVETQDLLNAWCGFETETMEESKKEHKDIFEKVQNWLPNYLDFLGNTDADHIAKINDTKAELCDRKDTWNVSGLEKTGKNGENQISFLRVIADAYHEGPLQVRYLKVKSNPFLYTNCNKSAAKKNFFLKTAALYCAMATEYKKKIRIGYPELSNWIGEGCLHSKKVGGFLTDLLYMNGNVCERLFAKETVEGNKNISKIILSEKWIKTTEAEIISEEDLESYRGQKNVYIYKDMGCIKGMERI